MAPVAGRRRAEETRSWARQRGVRLRADGRTRSRLGRALLAVVGHRLGRSLRRSRPTVPPDRRRQRAEGDGGLEPWLTGPWSKRRAEDADQCDVGDGSAERCDSNRRPDLDSGPEDVASYGAKPLLDSIGRWRRHPGVGAL
ncbi:putative pollen-specific leucine-rich repeat extensin-like protein 3 [Iris pallida]|uniref:Pollen-specific leucine-rich repeat extensin-like protein 3 n=1 Tax=Iris pallida TaxID=29817 RepID=A0AAX6G3H2_IRIPA|nr:putative pollen-specific leucine-rich repeat extensin-like protein 3 [Iris pallida]KAJ6823180.1 putative pollen-specific leucine-rich repeat extensin-like protein 3 [Iris pallida]